MIKLSKKSLMLFISAIAMAAFAMPSMASAATITFDGPGTHQLSSTNLGFTSATLGAGAGCATSDFTVVVTANTERATVTAATFDGCRGSGAIAGTTVHAAAIGLPWTITTVGVANQFTIDNVRVTNTVTGVGDITLEGNLTGSISCSTHVTTFANSGDLTATSGLGNGPATVSGTFTDSLNTLCLT